MLTQEQLKKLKEIALNFESHIRDRGIKDALEIESILNDLVGTNEQAKLDILKDADSIRLTELKTKEAALQIQIDRIKAEIAELEK